MENISKIEKHLYENKDSTVRSEYRVYKDPFVYDVKTRLNREEQRIYKENGKQIFHF